MLLKVAVNTITIYLQTLLYRPPAKPRSPKRRPPPRRVPREDPVEEPEEESDEEQVIQEPVLTRRPLSARQNRYIC